MSKLIAPLEKFFFGKMDLYPVALFRVIFTFLILIMYGTRFFEIRLIYFDEGLMPLSQAATFIPEFMKPLFYWFPASDFMVVVYMCIHMALLVLLLLGVLGQFTTWLALFFHLALLQRNYTAMYGADLFTTHFLFFLGFIQHNKYFTILKYFRGKNLIGTRSDLSSLGIRFIQIQLCVTYAYTGLEKIKGSMWWTGTAMWRVIANGGLVPVDLSFMVHFPMIIAIATYMTLFFEVYFGFAMMVPALRKPWLIVGAVMHILVAPLMGLYFFSGIMVAAYLVFFTHEELKKGCSTVTHFLRMNRST